MQYLKTCFYMLILMLLTITACKNEQAPIEESEIVGKFQLKVDESSLQGTRAKGGAIFALLDMQYVFESNNNYSYNYSLDGMTRQVEGQWLLSNDSLYTTNYNRPETYGYLFRILSRQEDGFIAMRPDSAIIHLTRMEQH